MEKYHKIQTVYKRDPETKFKTLTQDYAKPEFDYIAENMWTFTEKVDGMNIRIWRDNGELVVRGKTDRAEIRQVLLDGIHALIPDPSIIEDGFTLYGEGYGGKIQGGGKYRIDQSFVLFDVYHKERWCSREDVEGWADEHNIPVVPIVGHGDLCALVDRVKAGPCSKWGDFTAEGLVARPAVEMFNRFGERVITKLKCRDFPSPACETAGE